MIMTTNEVQFKKIDNRNFEYAFNTDQAGVTLTHLIIEFNSTVFRTAKLIDIIDKVDVGYYHKGKYERIITTNWLGMQYTYSSLELMNISFPIPMTGFRCMLPLLFMNSLDKIFIPTPHGSVTYVVFITFKTDMTDHTVLLQYNENTDEYPGRMEYDVYNYEFKQSICISTNNGMMNKIDIPPLGKVDGLLFNTNLGDPLYVDGGVMAMTLTNDVSRLDITTVNKHKLIFIDGYLTDSNGDKLTQIDPDNEHVHMCVEI